MKRLQIEALRRLDQLLAALKESQERPKPLSRGSGEGDSEPPSRGSAGDDSLPPPAQLKLLRMLQQEVNARTEAFHKKHPAGGEWGPKERVELQEISREQKEVADLLAQLTQTAGDVPEEAANPEKKDEEEKP